MESGPCDSKPPNDATASYDVPPLDVRILRTNTLENGFQYMNTTPDEGGQLLSARVKAPTQHNV